MQLDRHRNRRDDAIQRSDVAEELPDGMVAARDRELLAICVELLTRKNRHRLDRREIQTDAAGRRRYVFEKRGHFVAPRDELSHYPEALLVLRRLHAQLLQAA